MLSDGNGRRGVTESRTLPPPVRRLAPGPRRGPRGGSGTVAGGRRGSSPRVAGKPPRRSARRSTVRANSRAALTRDSPGTTNSRGISIRLSISWSASSTPSTIAAETRVSPSTWRPQAWGLVASSAAATNNSRWKRRIRSASPREARAQAAVLGLGLELGPGEAKRRHGFIDRAVCLGPEIVLPDAVAAEEQPRGPVVALAGGDQRINRANGRRRAIAASAIVGRRGPVTTSGPLHAGPSAPPAG